MAAQIGSRLQMRLPPVNAGALLHRYVQDLSLPEVNINLAPFHTLSVSHADR